jgi:hypothetical protein
MATLTTPPEWRERSVRYDRGRLLRPHALSSAAGLTQPAQQAAQPRAFKRGGKVHKGGLAMVHKGERVLTKREAKRRGR